MKDVGIELNAVSWRGKLGVSVFGGAIKRNDESFRGHKSSEGYSRRKMLKSVVSAM